MLGWCPECGASFDSPVAIDRLCQKCQASEDAVYANDSTPSVDTDPQPFSKAAMRERLGVTGDVDE